MVVTALILLPVMLILVWLYWYLLPGRRWTLADSVVMLILLLVDTLYIRQVDQMEFESGSPLWPYIVSATGAYGILILGLAMALIWRKYNGRY